MSNLRYSCVALSNSGAKGHFTSSLHQCLPLVLVRRNTPPAGKPPALTKSMCTMADALKMGYFVAACFLGNLGKYALILYTLAGKIRSTL